MVTPSSGRPLSPAVLAVRMAVYSAAFLAFILWLVPTGFDWLGRRAGAQAIWDARLGPPGAWQRGAGATLFVLGLTGYAVGSLWLVIVGRGPFVEFDPPREFVATGPYRWMRNPVAAALIVTVAGEAVYLGSAGIATLVLLGLLLAHLQVTRVEEPRLRSRFGESYEAYCRRVPRWLPRRPQ